MEAALAELAPPGAVRRAVATIRPGPGGAPRLVGYLLLAPAAAPGPGALDEAALRGRLAERLPAYMVPAVLVRLDELPLLPSGKVDLKRLPEPPSAATPQAASSAPGGPEADGLEARILAAFRVLLDPAPVGPESDFFAAGGNSLLAAQAASELRRTVYEGVSVRDVYDLRTAASLAAAVRLRIEAASPKPCESLAASKSAAARAGGYDVEAAAAPAAAARSQEVSTATKLLVTACQVRAYLTTAVQNPIRRSRGGGGGDMKVTKEISEAALEPMAAPCSGLTRQPCAVAGRLQPHHVVPLRRGVGHLLVPPHRPPGPRAAGRSDPRRVRRLYGDVPRRRRGRQVGAHRPLPRRLVPALGRLLPALLAVQGARLPLARCSFIARALESRDNS